MTTKTIEQKLRDDDYRPKTQLLDRPSRPSGLAKTLAEVDSQDLPALLQAKESYDTAVKQYEQAKKTYHEEEREGVRRFRADLEQEFGTKGHPKAGRLWEIAWERGHSGGFREVYGDYSELSELLS